jgi:hypothetical protein
MPLPETIPTKISSEAAGYVSLTPVGREDLSSADLIERIVAVTGKKADRINEILGRGSFVSGSSRYRWERITANVEEIEALLARLPDEQPERPFEAAKCHTIFLRGRRSGVEIRDDFAKTKRLFKKDNFWDRLLAALAGSPIGYERYSYADEADVYSVNIPFELARRIERDAALLKYTAVIQQIQLVDMTSAELYVER